MGPDRDLRNPAGGRPVLWWMGCFRVLLCVVFPPLAVLDKGCGPVAITALLTLAGWVPGVIAAIIFCAADNP